MASKPIDTSLFHLSASPQLSSPFFALLPAEIRNLIYVEYRKLCSSRQHIVLREDNSQQQQQQPDPAAEVSSSSGEPSATPPKVWSHIPCIADPRAEDVRLQKYGSTGLAWPEKKAWGRRLKSDWCLHWACEEQLLRPHPDLVELYQRRTAYLTARRSLSQLLGAQSLQDENEGQSGEGEESKGEGLGSGLEKQGKAEFLPLLLTCKRAYIECLPSLYSNTTFIFTDTPTAEEFLSHYASDTDRFPIRSLELSIRATNILTEIYYPPNTPGNDEGPPPVFAGQARPSLNMANNPWQRVCDLLIKLTNLQDLRIWFDSSDLRPWHKRVSEMRFFGKLFEVRVPDRNRFVLSLPELPTRRGPDAQVLQGHYLEGEKIENAPFVVERGPRPNNWRVHLRNIVAGGAFAL
ncbi:hypothetical protein VTI74DRAFT_6993 [Chaetomium olivicolor]